MAEGQEQASGKATGTQRAPTLRSLSEGNGSLVASHPIWQDRADGTRRVPATLPVHGGRWSGVSPLPTEVAKIPIHEAARRRSYQAVNACPKNRLARLQNRAETGLRPVLRETLGRRRSCEGAARTPGKPVILSAAKNLAGIADHTRFFAALRMTESFQPVNAYESPRRITRPFCERQSGNRQTP
jgi:hypothetical protein